MLNEVIFKGRYSLFVNNRLATFRLKHSAYYLRVVDQPRIISEQVLLKFTFR